MNTQSPVPAIGEERTYHDSFEISGLENSKMYIFNHLPKCAGLSYLALLRSIYGTAQVTHISLNEDVDYTIDAGSYQKYRVIMGHFGVKWNPMLGPGRGWLTALREPVDRVVSTYFYWRNNVPGSPDIPYLRLAQTLPFLEFIQSDHYLVRQGISNAQTWQLADDLRVRYRSVSEQDALEVAKINLSKFDFVGIYECFPKSVARLCNYLGVPVPAELPRGNDTIGRPAIAELSPTIVEAIKELNAADLALYQYATNLLGREAVWGGISQTVRDSTTLGRSCDRSNGTHMLDVASAPPTLEADSDSDNVYLGKSTIREWEEWHVAEEGYRWTAKCDAGMQVIVGPNDSSLEVEAFSGYPQAYRVGVYLDGLHLGFLEFSRPAEVSVKFKLSDHPRGAARLSFRVPWLWQPCAHIAKSTDRRLLGIAVRAIRIV